MSMIRRGMWVCWSVAIATGVIAGCSETDDDPNNIRGKVLLDEEGIQGVAVRVDDSEGARFDTTTDLQGDYEFQVAAGEAEVRLVSGIPDDAECSPNTRQTVDVPVSTQGFARADFACETPGSGGAGGAAGNGGMGGMGGTGGIPVGSGCGVALNDTSVDLAGDVTVSPLSAMAGTTIDVTMPVSAGVREIFINFQITSIPATVGVGSALTTGAETVVVPVTTFLPSGDPVGPYPAIIELVGTDTNMSTFYVTREDRSAVDRYTRTGMMFTTPIEQPDCSPVVFTVQ